MTKQEQFFHGLQLLKDWTAWMVTVEVGVISFLGSAYAPSDLTPWAVTTVVIFGLSGVAAACVLGGLPWIAINYGCTDALREGATNFYQAPLTDVPLLGRVKLWMVSTLQQCLFFFGIAALCITVVTGKSP